MRRLAFLAAGLASALVWSVSGAAARPARSQPAAESPMQVHLVRSAEPGCEPRCPEWIAAQGKIVGSSVARFRRVLRQIGDRKLPILIDSNGGRVNEAFEIGRMARALGLDVVVGRTVLMSCARADTVCHRRARARKVRLGLAKADQSKCASSCAFILAAGMRRLVTPTAFVGVHQIRSFYVYARVLRTYRVTATGKRMLSERTITDRIIETRTPQSTYDRIRSYFAEMGIGEAIMPLILATPGDQLHWLTRDELEATGLATDWIDIEERLTSALAPVPSVTGRNASDSGPEAAAEGSGPVSGAARH